MTTKNLVILTSVAVVLGGVAYWTSVGKRMATPSLNGKNILPAFKISDVAAVEINGPKKLVLSAGEAGWTIDALHGYPADVTKIRENLTKLVDLKVGQVVNGRKIENPARVELKDASGKAVATLSLGEAHISKPKGQMAQFGGGGYPDGRYVLFNDKVVLVKETLDAFDGDPKKWANTRICAITASDVTSVTYLTDLKTAPVKLTRKDSTWTLEGLGPKEEIDTSKTYSLDSALSYLDMTGIADPAKEAEYGFATGKVYTATLKNGITYTAKVGNAVGSDRTLKLSAAFAPVGTNATENAACEKTVKDFNDKNGKWIYTISSYAADSMSKKRADLVKAKEEPKKDEKKEEPKKDEPKKADAKK